MKELFRIGDKIIYVYGVGVALGLIAGFYILYRESRRKGLDQEKTFYLAILTVVAGIIGARLYYIIGFNLEYYIKNPLQIFAVRSGGLSIQGALLGGILFAIWYARKTGLPFFRTADAAAPGIAIGQAIGRIGCDVYGVPMTTIYPWGVKVGAQILHPAQMYEMFLDLILFTYLWKRRGKALSAENPARIPQNYIILPARIAKMRFTSRRRKSFLIIRRIFSEIKK
jgi:phosphatidylglycerol:prolipoprotein diacylglycerol transferase